MALKKTAIHLETLTVHTRGILVL